MILTNERRMYRVMLVKPIFKELSFRKELIADVATMSYNVK